MGDITNFAIDAERERAMSDMLAERAMAEHTGEGDLTSGLASVMQDVGDRMADVLIDTSNAMIEGVKTVGTGVVRLGQGLGRLEQKMEDGLESAVDSITDPIKRGFAAVQKELTSGIDEATAAGLVVGAVVSLGDEIMDGFTWLWDNWDKAIPVLGDMITEGVADAWEFWKSDILPEINAGLATIGEKIWNVVPEWMQEGMTGISDIAEKVVEISAGIGSFVSDGAAWISDGLAGVLRTFGFEGLAGVLDSMTDILKGLSDYLGIASGKEARNRQSAAGASASRGKVIGDIIAEGGPGEDAFARAKKGGATTGQAIHFATLANTNEAATQVGLEAFESAVASGMGSDEAYKLAFRAFQEAYGGNAAVLAPRGASVVPGEAVASAVESQGSELEAARKTQEALLLVAEMQQRAIELNRTNADQPVETLDTVGGPDELSFTSYNAGLAGGGQQ